MSLLTPQCSQQSVRAASRLHQLDLLGKGADDGREGMRPARELIGPRPARDDRTELACAGGRPADELGCLLE